MVPSLLRSHRLFITPLILFICNLLMHPSFSAPFFSSSFSFLSSCCHDPVHALITCVWTIIWISNSPSSISHGLAQFFLSIHTTETLTSKMAICTVQYQFQNCHLLPIANQMRVKGPLQLISSLFCSSSLYVNAYSPIHIHPLQSFWSNHSLLHRRCCMNPYI